MIPKESNNTPDYTSFKNNLIQNFYIIGLSPEDFFKIDKKENKGEFLDIFGENSNKELNITPKILTKFPNGKMCINTIPDNIIIEHCFPNGVINPTKNSQNQFFQFKFDNLPQNYENCYWKIYSNIYLTCLEINEPLINYYKYKHEIISLINKTKSIEIAETDNFQSLSEEDEKKFSEIFIPKVICFASVLPFYNELSNLLDFIYKFYLSKKNFSCLPLEKVIAQIISTTYIPINPKEELIINFNTENFKNVIKFPQNMLEEINIDNFADLSLLPMFQLFTPEDILKIFRYILFEIPILFFCSNKSLCSLFVNVFLTMLSPFKYVFPHISILPKKLYGIIGSEKRFIFGINETYEDDFFENNKIELNKTIIIISIDKSKNPPTKIEEKIYDNNNKEKIYIIMNYMSKPSEDTIMVNGNPTSILSVDIPNYFKKRLLENINKYLSLMRKKSAPKKDAAPINISLNIKNSFYKFFVDIMEGYTDFFMRSKYLYNDDLSNNINIGENIFIKNNDRFKKEIFNDEEFIAKSQKDYASFYRIFFKTEMFSNFLRERIYHQDIATQLAFKQFDQITFLKKHSDSKKKKENKKFYENFKNDIFEKIEIQKNNEIIIKEEEAFNENDFEDFIKNKNQNVKLLLNFGQLFQFNEKEKNYDLNYLIFPKLNFEYMLRNNSKQLYLINDFSLIDYKNICLEKMLDYEKVRPYAFYTSFLRKVNKTNISCINYEIHSKNYIIYIYLMLLTASIWYCEEDEKNNRLDKLLSQLNGYEFMEEYLLNFIFLNIYKSASVYYLVKFFMIYYKMVGYINYYLLSLLTDKIQNNSDETESENEIKNNKEVKRDLVYSKRYLISPEYNFDNEMTKDENNPDNNIQDIDELIFCSEQVCPKCKEICNIDVNKIPEIHMDLNINCYNYKCVKCKESYDMKIKYQILKLNYISKEVLLIESGEFTFLTPFKLYKDLKSYFINENTTQLDINKIFSIGNKINLYNIIYYFSILKLNYDFLFPYEAKFKTNLKMIFKNIEKEKAKKNKKPIKLTFNNNQINFRRFNNIQPWLNIKKKNSKILGFIKRKDTYIESELSFTIKKTKNKNTKKK